MVIDIVNAEGLMLAHATSTKDTVSSDELLRMTTAVYKLRADALKSRQAEQVPPWHPDANLERSENV